MSGLDAKVGGGLRVAEPTAGTRVDGRPLERLVARILAAGTYVSVTCLLVGVFGMLATGISPLEPVRPAFDPSRLIADILALRPAGFLWLGIVVAIALPSARVAASLAGYVRDRDPRMVAISLAILFVVGLGVVIGLTATA